MLGQPYGLRPSLFTTSHQFCFRASGGEGGWTTCLPWLSGGALSAPASVPGGPPCWASLRPSLFTTTYHFRASGGEGGWSTCLPWLSGGALSAPASVPEAATSFNKRITLNVGGERHEAHIHLLPHAFF